MPSTALRHGVDGERPRPRQAAQQLLHLPSVLALCGNRTLAAPRTPAAQKRRAGLVGAIGVLSAGCFARRRLGAAHRASCAPHRDARAPPQRGAQRCQAGDPAWDAADAERLAEGVREMAAVLPQRVVPVARPLLHQAPQQIVYLLHREVCPAHGNGLTVHVSSASPWRAEKYTRLQVGVGALTAKAPLGPKNLHAGMVRTRPNDRQHVVPTCNLRPEIVDV
mmetsp:Transcript_46974/g.134352  ORF Transcript_46974/g.134352 Transcript_46974/m.134352 type:complete len:222 (+) Transcript_46974:1419-2084(+)